MDHKALSKPYYFLSCFIFPAFSGALANWTQRKLSAPGTYHHHCICILAPMSIISTCWHYWATPAHWGQKNPPKFPQVWEHLIYHSSKKILKMCKPFNIRIFVKDSYILNGKIILFLPHPVQCHKHFRHGAFTYTHTPPILIQYSQFGHPQKSSSTCTIH